MKTYYFHYRLDDRRATIVGDFTAALFEQPLAARGGLTVAYRLVGEDAAKRQVEVEVGVAFCSLKDNYDKSVGRLVAWVMLEEKPLLLTMGHVLFDAVGRLNFAHLRYRLIDALADDPAFNQLVPRKFPIDEVI